MNELMIICLVGIVACTTILTIDTIKYIKSKKMINRTINNCFKILKEKEVK
jgi:hypothetical protein